MVIAAAGAAASSGMGASVIINLILNFVLSASMNQMLGSIKNMQVIVHLCLMMNLLVPPNSQLFFDEIFKMTKFDPVDLSELGIDFELVPLPADGDDEDDDEEFDEDEDDSDDDEAADKDAADAEEDEEDESEMWAPFVQLGYESDYFLMNLGGLLLAIILQAVLILVTACIYCNPKCS